MYFALSLSLHVKVQAQNNTQIMALAKFLTDLWTFKMDQLHKPTAILGTFLLLSCDRNRVPK